MCNNLRIILMYMVYNLGMNREYIKTSLEAVGYKPTSVASILIGRRKPYEKQYDLLDNFKIPLEAWRDIKSFMSHHNAKNQQLQDVS